MTSSAYLDSVVRHNLDQRHGTVTSVAPRGLDAYLLHVELPGGLPATWRSEECEVISRPRSAGVQMRGAA
jgi:hypothetical protein